MLTLGQSAADAKHVDVRPARSELDHGPRGNPNLPSAFHFQRAMSGHGLMKREAPAASLLAAVSASS